MSSPFEPFGSQDLKDDDGPVIDSLFKETDAPPNLKDATEPIVVRALKEPAKITRLISREFVAAIDWTVFQILPADANRESLVIRVYSPTQVATDGFRFSDDSGNVITSAKILHSDDTTFIGHTGPIYAIPCGAGANGIASAPVALQVWAVTS